MNNDGITFCLAENGCTTLDTVSDKPHPTKSICKQCKKLKEKKNPRKKRKVNKKKKTIKGFYSSWAWKKLRFETLKKYGAVCMLCGSKERIVGDHIKPRRKFPELELDPENIQVLCNDCNMGKSNDDYTDFRPREPRLAVLMGEAIDLDGH